MKVRNIAWARGIHDYAIAEPSAGVSADCAALLIPLYLRYFNRLLDYLLQISTLCSSQFFFGHVPILTTWKLAKNPSNTEVLHLRACSLYTTSSSTVGRLRRSQLAAKIGGWCQLRAILRKILPSNGSSDLRHSRLSDKSKTFVLKMAANTAVANIAVVGAGWWTRKITLCW